LLRWPLGLALLLGLGLLGLEPLLRVGRFEDCGRFDRVGSIGPNPEEMRATPAGFLGQKPVTVRSYFSCPRLGPVSMTLGPLRCALVKSLYSRGTGAEVGKIVGPRTSVVMGNVWL
jgi:hypothetical protein